MSLFSSCVQAAESSMTVEPGTFEEKYDPNVNVSGQIRAGLMYGGTSSEVGVNNLQIHFPFSSVDKGSQVCIRLVSRNGVYSARWLATANQNIAKGGAANVEITTDKDDELAGYSTNALVGTATLGGNCKSVKQTYLPLSWGEGNRKSLEVFLNADATDSSLHVKFSSDDDTAPSTASATCQDLTRAEKSLAFDTACSISWDSKAVPAIVVVKRSSFSKPMENIRFDLDNSD